MFVIYIYIYNIYHISCTHIYIYTYICIYVYIYMYIHIVSICLRRVAHCCDCAETERKARAETISRIMIAAIISLRTNLGK